MLFFFIVIVLKKYNEYIILVYAIIVFIKGPAELNVELFPLKRRKENNSFT